MDSYLKKPVNAMLPSTPTGKGVGYRYINTTDQKLYELQADGTWIVDENFILGCLAVVIGDLGDSIRYASYCRPGTALEIKNPHFNSSNTQNANLVIKWVDRIVIARHDGVNICSLICVFPDGTSTIMRSGVTGCYVSSMCVDGRNSLWVGYHEFSGKTPSGKLERYAFDDDSHPTPESFSFESGDIPSDNISALIAVGLSVWIVTALAAEFHISVFDGYEFSDKTAAFFTDTGVELAEITGLEWYDLAADESGLLMFSMHASAIDNLYYYADGHFYVKALPAFSKQYLQKFAKIGDTVICLVTESAVAGSAGDVVCWSWKDETVIYEVSKNASGLKSNGTDIITFSPAGSIDRFRYPWTSSTRMSAWESQIAAINAQYEATQNIIDFFASSQDYLLVNYKSADTKVNTIIRISVSAKWQSN